MTAGLIAAAAAAVLAATTPGEPEAPARPPRPAVALTFDDLPVHAPLPPGLTRADVARSLVQALDARRAPPAYGFVNGKGLTDEPGSGEALRIWRAAGHRLANHGFSHMDLDAHAPEAFEQDVLANEATLREHMGDEDWRWFRYPYLHEGSAPEKRGRVARFLAQRGYRIADVTLNFDDWAFSEPYARCAAKGDLHAIEWMQERCLHRAQASLVAGREAARRLYGREIPHVMLLHAGAFTATVLPQLLALLERHGFELVPLDQAQSDPAYAEGAEPSTPPGMPLLQRMLAARGLELPAPADDTLERLGALCR